MKTGKKFVFTRLLVGVNKKAVCSQMQQLRRTAPFLTYSHFSGLEACEQPYIGNIFIEQLFHTRNLPAAERKITELLVIGYHPTPIVRNQDIPIAQRYAAGQLFLSCIIIYGTTYKSTFYSPFNRVLTQLHQITCR